MTAFRLTLMVALLVARREPCSLSRRGDRDGGRGPHGTAGARGKRRRADARGKGRERGAKACKIEICGVLATKDPAGPDISCDIVKTWREAAITKMLGGKFDLPWGKAVCQSKLVVEREVLAMAMSEASYEAVMPSQKLSCTLDQKKDGKPYTIDVSIAPKVAFENGKAVTAS